MLRSVTSATRLVATTRTLYTIAKKIVAKDTLHSQKKLQDENTSVPQITDNTGKPIYQNPSIIIGGSQGGLDPPSKIASQIEAEDALDIQDKLKDDKSTVSETMNGYRPSLVYPSIVTGGSIGGSEKSTTESVTNHKTPTFGYTDWGISWAYTELRRSEIPNFLKPAVVIDDKYQYLMLADDYRKAQFRKHLKEVEESQVQEDDIPHINLFLGDVGLVGIRTLPISRLRDSMEEEEVLASGSKEDAENEDVQYSENVWIAKRYSMLENVMGNPNGIGY
jgi:hypothetical protein